MAKRQLSCTDAGSSQGFLGSKLDSPTVWPDQQEQDLVLFVHNWFDPGRLFAELLVFRWNVSIYGLTYFSRFSLILSPPFSRKEGDFKGTIKTLSRHKS